MARQHEAQRPTDLIPKQPVHRLTEPFARFLHIETASGVVLLVAALIASLGIFHYGCRLSGGTENHDAGNGTDDRST